MRQLDPTTARLLKWLFEGLVLRLERLADSISVEENWTVRDRNLRIALVFDRLEPTITAAAASIYRAAAADEFKRRPGPFDTDALDLLYPQPGEVQADRKERVIRDRERNLVANRDSRPRVTSGEWLRLLAALQENLIDLELRLDAELAGRKKEADGLA